MIHESSDWKEPLLKSALRFRRNKSQRKLTERTLAQIERDVFIGFYSIRKIFEALGRVTDATKTSVWPCVHYRNIKRVTSRNNHRIDENYDMSKALQETRDLPFFCHRIIHSCVFGVFVRDNGGFDGVYFSSDTDKDKKLYVLTVDQLVEIFERVGNDYPVQVNWKIDPVTAAEIVEAN
jgi:hypothetical protein